MRAAEVCSCDRIGQYYYTKTEHCCGSRRYCGCGCCWSTQFAAATQYTTRNAHIKVMMKQQIENDNLIHISGKWIRMIWSCHSFGAIVEQQKQICAKIPRANGEKRNQWDQSKTTTKLRKIHKKHRPKAIHQNACTLSNPNTHTRRERESDRQTNTISPWNKSDNNNYQNTISKEETKSQRNPHLNAHKIRINMINKVFNLLSLITFLAKHK